MSSPQQTCRSGMKSTYAQQLAPPELPYGLGMSIPMPSLWMSARMNLWGVSKDEKNITFEIFSRIFTPLTLRG